jgi:hypothetical protein
VWCGVRLLFIDMDLNGMFCPKSVHDPLAECCECAEGEEERRGEGSIDTVVSMRSIVVSNIL